MPIPLAMKRQTVNTASCRRSKRGERERGNKRDRRRTLASFHGDQCAAGARVRRRFGKSLTCNRYIISSYLMNKTLVFF